VKNHLVILTCTVKTKMTFGMKRSEQSVRLNDYTTSIRAWSELSKKIGFKILVIENSDSLITLQSSLSNLDNPYLEFAQTTEDQRSHIEGNSAGEFQMLKEILDTKLIPAEIEFIWKVTGRLFIRNFRRLAPIEKSDFILNRLYNPIHLVDTRIICFSPKGFRSLFSQDPKFILDNTLMHNGEKGTYSSFEHFVTLEVLHSEFFGDAILSMKEVPIFMGHSGTSNKEIDGQLSRIKKLFANFFRPLIVKLLVGSTP